MTEPEIGVGSVLDGEDVDEPRDGEGSVLDGADVAPRLDLTPAEHVVPAPEGGWSGSDVGDDELVDDQFIAADPTSKVVTGGA